MMSEPVLDSIVELSWSPADQGLKENEEMKLHHLAKEGQEDKIRKFLQDLDTQQVPDYLEKRNSKGSTPLHVAAYYGNKAAIQVLQEYGAHVHYRNKLGWSSYNYASRWSQPLDMRLSMGLLQKNPKNASSAFSFRAVREKKVVLEKGSELPAPTPGTTSSPALSPLVQLRGGGSRRGQQSVRSLAGHTDLVRETGLRSGLKMEDRMKSDSGISVFDSKEVLNYP